jgi:diguanylate cyclase (GGDEF)-like protein
VHERLLNFAKHGAPYWLDIRISALRNEAGRITHFVAIERDVTMEMRRIDELEFIADRDTLTGIPNRGAFQRVLGAEIARIEAGGGAPASAAGLCVAFINVDNFKRVNGAFGRATGNAALVVLAECIADNVRRSDLLGRIGGQEFAVCMPGITLDCAESFAERLRYAVTANPLKTVSGPVRLTVSVGVAIFSAGDSVPSMMMRAANAMCAAKRDGGNSVRIQLPRFA